MTTAWSPSRETVNTYPVIRRPAARGWPAFDAGLFTPNADGAFRCGHAVGAVSVLERSGHMTIDYDSPQQLVRTPQQVNEFICTRCIHVRQLSELAADRSLGRICRECA